MAEKSVRTPGKIVSGLLDAIDLRANSALITIFGDAISQRGGKIWLGSLITLAASLNISERLVRTGVYRLSNEGWLQSETHGRRAYYTLTDAGAEKFHEAQRRIYASETVLWDNEWRLIHLLAALPQASRTQLKRELGWLGFGQIGPTLFAHPTESIDAIARILKRHNITDDTLVFRAKLTEVVRDDIIHGVVRNAWHLDELNKEYERFISSFMPLETALKNGETLSGQDIFALRILIIHDFRRALLKDPVLPDKLLPADWSGGKARDLCARIYRQISDEADAYLVSVLKAGTDDIPSLPVSYHARFTGPSHLSSTQPGQ